jgi:hypothetical protein
MFGAPSSIIARALASQNDPFVRHAYRSSENVARVGLIDRCTESLARCFGVIGPTRAWFRSDVRLGFRPPSVPRP